MLQDELSSLGQFASVCDSALGLTNDYEHYYNVVTACLKRHSARPRSTEVCLNKYNGQGARAVFWWASLGDAVEFF